jgi:hypothetical protein
MACYSYTNPLPPILFTNIEVSHNISGTTYSYANLYFICEFSESSQLRVYGKTAGNVETLLTQGTDYTVNETNDTITTLTSLAAYTQIVMRRATLSDRMITFFSEGAKLTARDLNDCFHQLLFLNQEKQFIPANVTVNYPISTVVAAFQNGTNYVIGNLVSFSNSIYKCIQNTNSVSPPTATHWLLINPQFASFVITGNAGPVEFDLSSLNIGRSLVWNGSKFVTSVFSGSLTDLSDVVAGSAMNGDLLIYNSSPSKWTATTPSFNIAANPVIFNVNRVFYPTTSLSYFNPAGQALNISTVNQLNGFKDAQNRWVLTDAPTVYHIVKKILPSETDPVAYFNNVTNSLTGLAASISNPVKIKFEWNLNLDRANIVDADASTGADLGDFRSMFWNKPGELYSAVGYNLSAAGPLLFHGVIQTNSPPTIRRTSPYFNQTYQNNDSFTSKLKGYGIKAFYLSVPECYTTSLKLPIFSLIGGEENLFYTPSGNTNNLSIPGIKSALNSIVSESSSAFNNGNENFKDFYLIGLRDLAFAGGRNPNNPAVADMRQRDNVARLMKNYLIAADYDFDLGGSTSTVSYKRLESAGETAASCLWKIPSQIIYYNKASLALASSDTNASGITTTSSILTPSGIGSVLPSTRFQGWHRLQRLANANSTTTNIAEGFYYKASKLWQDWQTFWSTETAGTGNSNYRFNEADIDWFTSRSGVTGANLNSELKLYRISYDLPSYTVVSPGGTTAQGKWFVPWLYRPNDIRFSDNPSQAVTEDGFVGSHLLNIDSNILFSTASNYIPDPEDEYVFRLVAKSGLTNFFTQAGFTNIKSSIILEYGLTTNPNNQKTSSISSNTDIYKTHFSQLTNNAARSFSRMDFSKVKVYIKNESIENIGGTTRYVITIAIRVPRLKSIGYSRVYRQYKVGNSAYPIPDNSTTDSETDGGPWTYNGYSTGASASNIGSWYRTTPGNNSRSALFEYGDTQTETINDTDSSNQVSYKELISGRNECAVKFTNLGIPSNLWIRLSVLNTEGTLDLINANGFINTNE